MKKISKSLYFGIMFGGMVATFIQILMGLIFLDSYETSDIAFGYMLIFLGAASGIAAGIFFLILIYKLWDGIQVANPRSTPGKAIGFLFIPFFNFYWAFQCYWGFAVDFNRYISEKNYEIPKMSEGIPLTFCILQICGLIPFVNILTAIPSIILLIIFLSKAIDSVNELSTIEQNN